VQKRKIRTLHKMDLERFLESLALYDAFLKGELVCNICHTPIKKENIGFIFPLAGAIKFCCDKAECLFDVAKLEER